MRAIRTVLLTLLLLTAAAPAAPAAAAEGPPGAGCVSVAVLVVHDQRAGVLAGGPLAGTGTLTCSLQYADGHDAPDLFTATASGTDVVVVPPHRVSYYADAVYTCTAFTPLGGQTLFLTQAPGGAIVWSTDPASPCAAATDPAYLDTLVCLVLKALAPGLPPAVTIEPGGDVYVAGEFFWDCPPYGEWGSEPEGPGDPVEALFAIVESVDELLDECHAENCDPWYWPTTVTCTAFAAVAPGLPPYLVTNSEGDVFLEGEPFWDCPPYEPFEGVA